MQIHFNSLLQGKLLASLLITLSCLLAPNMAALAQDEALNEMPSGKYELDLSHASVLWKVSHFGFSMYPGRFTDFSVDLDLSSNDFTKSSVKVEIRSNSIQTAYPYPEKENFDEVLAKDWFKSEEFPTISFVSTDVSALEGNTFVINGTMSMLGQSHPVKLNASLNKATKKHPFVGKPVIGFSASTTINRTLWGLKKYAPSIGKDVEIAIEGEFSYAE